MGFLDRFKSEREKKLKDKSLVKESARETAVQPEKKTKTSSSDQSIPVKTKNNLVKKEDSQKKLKAVPQGLGRVILHPLVTEKASIAASQGTYIFVVDQDANRIVVREAVEAIYGVKPVSVNIQNIRGKKVRFGRYRGQRKSWKKALVTLPPGQSIDVYEGA